MIQAILGLKTATFYDELFLKWDFSRMSHLTDNYPYSYCLICCDLYVKNREKRASYSFKRIQMLYLKCTYDTLFYGKPRNCTQWTIQAWQPRAVLYLFTEKYYTSFQFSFIITKKIQSRCRDQQASKQPTTVVRYRQNTKNI